MLRGRDVVEMPIVYVRDNPDVQRFVEQRVRNFNPFCVPETSRDILDAAIAQFGLLPCFYFEIMLH
jgi:hypothetical protein